MQSVIEELRNDDEYYNGKGRYYLPTQTSTHCLLILSYLEAAQRTQNISMRVDYSIS